MFFFFLTNNHFSVLALSIFLGALAQQREENKSEKKNAFGLLFSYMESCEECQFTMKEISEKLGKCFFFQSFFYAVGLIIL